MSKLDTNYIINLDLIKDRVNSVMKFCLVDVETSDFYLVLYNNGTRIFDKNYTVTLYVVKPNGNFKTIELEPKENLKKYYCNLPDTLKNIHGEYLCQAVIFDNSTGEKKISKSKFKYSVDLDLASEMAGIIDEEEQESILTDILNRLLTLENPVEPYATQKHVDECVSTLTEEIDSIKVKDTEQDGRLNTVETKNNEQDNRLDIIEAKDIEQDNRLVNIESKNTEQDNRLNIIESKDIEQDGRLNTLENKVDGIDEKIVGTIEPTLANHGNRVDTLENKDLVHESRMTDIESKNVEQDNRLTSIEGINTTQDNRLDALEAKDIAHESRMANIETKNTEQDNRLNSLESKDLIHESRMTDIKSKNIEQDERLSNIESKNTEQDGRLDITENRLANIGNDITNTMQPIIDEHTSRLNDIEAIDIAQNTRLDAIEVKNQQQDDRLLDIEKVNKRQDIDLKCLFTEAKNNMMDITEEGNSVYLQNSTEGHVFIDEIKGNTLVNCNKEPDKEIILNGNINTQGYGNVTLTEGVDGGLVDVALEGNTMVNVCDQKDPVAITKSYTVETGNHIALQGEYDGKCRPVVNGNTLVNLWQRDKLTKSESNINIDDSGYISIPTQNSYVSTIYSDLNIKIGSTYTYIIEVSEFSLLDSNGTTQNELLQFVFPYGWANTLSIKSTGYYTGTFTANEIKTTNNFRLLRYGGTTGNFKARITILEGYYTNKPIPEYFEGLQSSFEDKVVTQEMVDAGEELAENLGKYRVDYVVTGKNKFDKSKALINYSIVWETGIVKPGSYENNYFATDYIPVTPGVTYHNKREASEFAFYDINKNFIKLTHNETVCTIPLDCHYVRYMDLIKNLGTSQIEEGTKATTYEPYKEYTKTFYLNSPLLEGDTIEQQGDNVVHVHRSELRAYETDDELTLRTDMTNTLVAKSTPQYEVISQNDTILCDSYVNGHLDVDSVVPIEEVDFLHFEKDLTYLYANTQYTVQFTSDKAVTVDITLGGAQLLSQSIVSGLNRITITTPETLADNKLIIDGVGANISNIVVTEATDQDFGYFEEMKSVGECEDLAVVSSNSDGTLSTTQTLTHEPLRAIGDIKDKYVLIDGKWYIERNCAIATIDDITLNAGYTFSEYSTMSFIANLKSGHKHINYRGKIKCNYIKDVEDKNYSSYRDYDYICLWQDPTAFFVGQIRGLNSIEAITQYFIDNKIKVIYALKTPVYEPIDYNPLEVYSDVTHISNNSTIPCNMTIKNTGFNCLLKPSTTYTVSSNLGLNTVTTPSTLTEDCLRFYDTDTSDVTTMKDVLVLEGDYTTGKPLPSHFSGIESAFEQEYDEAVGKYKVKIRVQNEDASKENYIEFYIDEPLRGIRDVKDRIYVKDDKVVVERNCGQREYQDGDFGTYLTDKVNTVYQLAEPTYEEVEYNDVKLFIESFKNSTLFYNSNIPVTSKLYYSYSVPLVNKVAQTASISDEQDSMIIDLATQCAVMEMYLM